MSAGGPSGACHCGAVTVGLPRLPDEITRCNCTVCTKLGTTWGYFDPAEVTIGGGPLQSYVRADMAEPCLELHRCARCGCVVDWRDIRATPAPRMGINMNLFEPDDLTGIELRPCDGRNWPL